MSDIKYLKVIQNRYIADSGCMPHDCNGHQGFFIIDRMKKLAWCVEYNEGYPASSFGPGDPRWVKFWGVLRSDDVIPRKLIADWLTEVRISWSELTPVTLPPDVSKLYGSSPIQNYPTVSVVSDASGRTTIEQKAIALRTQHLSPVALFKIVAPSIYMVRVKTSDNDELQGSAVAVSPDTLLTNCHLVSNASAITLMRRAEKFGAYIKSANIAADRCILKASQKLNNFVPVRPFDGLEIGERVYSIGAPLGLELTLADGLLSAKRSEFGERFIQTTAAISPGSSGGGLFDGSGNLIGITTFMLKESENLNFAIAAQEFVSR